MRISQLMLYPELRRIRSPRAILYFCHLEGKVRFQAGELPIRIRDHSACLHHLLRFADVQHSLSLGEVPERTGFERTIVSRILKLWKKACRAVLKDDGIPLTSIYRPKGDSALVMHQRAAIHFPTRYHTGFAGGYAQSDRSD